MKSEIPLLYHYTSFTSAASIIKSGELRLFRSTAMSDPMEVNLGVDLLVETLVAFALANKTNDSLIERIALILTATCDLFNLYGRESVHDAYKRIKASEHWSQKYIDTKEPNQQRAVYLASFSSEPDSLMQWRLYGDNGAGVALGFRFVRGEHIMFNDRRVTIHVAPVFYNQEKMKEGLASIVSEAVSSSDADFRHVLGRLWLNASLLKQSDYKHEREWRAFIWTNVLDENPNVDHDGVRIRPYLSVKEFGSNENRSSKLPIVSVTTGPRSPFRGDQDQDWNRFVSKHVESNVSKIDFLHSSKSMR